MAFTDTQMQETLRRYRAEPQSFSAEQQATLAQIQGRLLAAHATAKAQTVRQQAAKVKADAVKAEMKAHDELERTLAELETHEEVLEPDDAVAVAELNLARAKATARYRPLAIALEQAREAEDDAQRDLQAAEVEEQRWT